LPNWFWLISVTVYGACVGSFLNVVIYRLPEGKSLVHPGSRCPSCDHALAWYDNVPVLAWLWLRAKCRYCKAPISAQYPLVEAVTGLMFAGLFAAYYMTDLRWEFSDPGHGFQGTWQIYVVHALLLAGLIAATMIDARLFIIPGQIPWLLTLVALVVLPIVVLLGSPFTIDTLPSALQPLASWIGAPVYLDGLVPRARPMGVWAAAGGTIGLAISLLLLKLKVIPLSFADYDELYLGHAAAQPTPPKGEDEEPFNYPHPRREVLKEILFLLPPILGIAVGVWLAPRGIYPLSAGSSVLGGVMLGYLFGAGLVWGTRILGTLLFGKEAMGRGDVHLLAAIGAILGPGETIPVFFIAPFFGLTAVLATMGLSAMLKKRFHEIPYGPYLAAAAVVVMVFRQPIMDFLQPLMRIFDILFIVYKHGG
jgi:leader peptidase (prepilin peptidase) / N-methyltransferase